MPDKSKFEREIDEILEKSEDAPSSSKRTKRQSGKHRSYEPFSPNVPKSKPRKRSGSIKINPGNLIIGGLVLLAVAAFTPTAKVPLAILGVALVAVGYLLWFRNGSPTFRGNSGSSRMFGRGKPAAKSESNEPEVKYWRGRRIEDKPEPKGRGKIIDFGSPPDDDKK